MSAFLEEVSLMTDIDNYDETADTVVMMTMHSAKGLEFPVAFLPGFEEGIFPGLQAICDPNEIQEERRLCYVAITRAKESLYLLNADSRMLFGSTSRNRPSPVSYTHLFPKRLICSLSTAVWVMKHGFTAMLFPLSPFLRRPKRSPLPQ